MKNILKTLCLFLFTINISCKAQIIPLNSVDYPDGAYLKDLDNILPFWEGTWKGTVNNKEYTIQFVKFTQHQTTFSDGSFEYEDLLMGKFKVMDLSTNQILYNDLNTTIFNDYKIQLNGKLGTEYFFMFFDTQSNCNNTFKFSLVKDNTNPNQVLYTNFSFDEYDSWDCQYQNQEDIPMFLPQTNLTLTKQ
ncbi:DUF6705 family protein [Flavobacterium ponti]|uniref:DUF6705 family protein n=1 Tax=Flavobacterium ponti TaxID=665133 RepID=A0ABV9P564_9FLAO